MRNYDPCKVLEDLWQDLKSKGRWVPGFGVAVRDTSLEYEYEQKLQSGGFRLPSHMLEFKPNTIYAWMDRTGKYIQKLMLVTRNDAYDWRSYDSSRLSDAAAREWLEELGPSTRADLMTREEGPNKLLYYDLEINIITGELECHYEMANIAYKELQPADADDDVVRWNGWRGKILRIAWKNIPVYQIACLNFPNGLN